MTPFSKQIRNNAVALISLAIAITSLAYNTWRNEQSEENRTLREATVTTLMQLADLESRMNLARWGTEENRLDHYLGGWSNVLAIKDTGTVLPENTRTAIALLFDAWDERDSPLLGKGDIANEAAFRIQDRIEAVRLSVLVVLEDLT